jgi:hypothetical protein
MNSEMHRPIRRHIKALSSILQLFDAEVDVRIWERVRTRLADLVERTAATDFDDRLETHIRSFDPVVIYRRDPALWEVAIYAADKDGHVLAFHFDDMEAVSLFALDRQFPVEGSFFERKPNILQQFREAVVAGALEDVGQEKYFALWVNRGYDTLLRISQIRVLREKYQKEFTPRLALRERGNMFEAADVLPFVSQVEKVAEPANWREQLGLRGQLIEFIEISGELAVDNHPNMIDLIRQMSACESEFLDAKTAAGSIVLLVSLDFEKRQFMEQEALIKRMIAYLSLRGKRIVLIVNGMTGMVDAPDDFPQVCAAEAQIIARIVGHRPGLDVIHMHNRTFTEKAALYRHVDYFLAPLGNASIIPQALDLPGIMYGPPGMLASFGWICEAIPSRATLIDRSWSSIIDVDAALTNYDWGHDDGSRNSYRIDLEKLSALAVRQIDRALRRKFGV